MLINHGPVPGLHGGHGVVVDINCISVVVDKEFVSFVNVDPVIASAIS